MNTPAPDVIEFHWDCQWCGTRKVRLGRRTLPFCVKCDRIKCCQRPLWRGTELICPECRKDVSLAKYRL